MLSLTKIDFLVGVDLPSIRCDQRIYESSMWSNTRQLRCACHELTVELNSAVVRSSRTRAPNLCTFFCIVIPPPGVSVCVCVCVCVCVSTACSSASPLNPVSE
jgi:hypothetical protein